MKPAILCIIILALLWSSSACADAVTVKAYCDGQEATVENVTLKAGQPFEVRLTVITDSDAVVHAMIYEPGYVPAYEVLSGPGKDIIVTRYIGAGEEATFTWTVAPSGAWTGAKAPLNVAFKVLEERDGAGKKLTSGQFTVVNAFIEEGRYEPASAPCASVPAALLIVVLLLGRKGT